MGLGFQDQDSKTTQEQGVSPSNRARAFEPSFNYGNRLAFAGTNLFESPAPVVPLNERGLLPQQEIFANSLFNQALSKASAGGALRGRLTPDYTPAYISSAFQNIAPFILDMIQRNVMQSIFAPEQVRLGRIQAGAQSINPLVSLSTGGGTSTTTSGGSGFDIGSIFAPLGTEAAGKAIFGSAAPAAAVAAAPVCWIAMEIYGPTSAEVDFLRPLLLAWERTSWLGRMVVGVYRKYGRQLARWMAGSSVKQAPFKMMFDRILRASGR